jgi:hypothetical protein
MPAGGMAVFPSQNDEEEVGFRGGDLPDVAEFAEGRGGYGRIPARIRIWLAGDGGLRLKGMTGRGPRA